MISVEKISKSFSGKFIFRNLSLVVKPGQLAGIIGPSGAGKSTLLRCVNGLEAIDEGQVIIDRFEIRAGQQLSDSMAAAIRRHVGMVFQHLNLWPYKTALENIIEGLLCIKKMKKADAIKQAMLWAERLGIAEHLEKYPGMLSGGQRQRVAIARAVVMEPQFLLLDEITSALDPVLAGELADTMLHLKEQGLGIVVVSHQIDFIRRNADLVYFMQCGKFKESGSPEEVIVCPKTPELRQFLKSVQHGW